MEQEFSAQLKKLRTENGLTLKQLAYKSNVSYMTIYLIEKEKVKPRGITAYKICKGLEKKLNISEDRFEIV